MHAPWNIWKMVPYLPQGINIALCHMLTLCTALTDVPYDIPLHLIEVIRLHKVFLMLFPWWTFQVITYLLIFLLNHAMLGIHMMLKYIKNLKIVHIAISEFHCMVIILVLCLHNFHLGLIFHGNLLDSILQTPINMRWAFKGQKNIGFWCRHIIHENIANILNITNTGHTPCIIMFFRNGNIILILRRGHGFPKGRQKTVVVNIDIRIN